MCDHSTCATDTGTPLCPLHRRLVSVSMVASGNDSAKQEAPLQFLDDLLASMRPDEPDGVLNFACRLHVALNEGDAGAQYVMHLYPIALEAAHPAGAVRELLVQVPAMLQDNLPKAPNTLTDVAQVLATAFWMHNEPCSEDASVVLSNAAYTDHDEWQSAHTRLVGILQYILCQARVHKELHISLAVDTAGYTTFLHEGLEDLLDGTHMDAMLLANECHLIIPPEAVVAALGKQSLISLGSGRAQTFAWLVCNCEKALAKRAQVSETSVVSVRLLAHIHSLMRDAVMRLTGCMLTTGRQPTVRPSQAWLLEAYRAYATLLVANTCSNGRKLSRSATTTAVLLALTSVHGGADACAVSDPLGKQRDVTLPPPLTSLFDSDVTSTYYPVGGQNSAFWAILRVALSCDDGAEVNRVVDAIFEANKLAPGTGAAVAMLCAMMHTRAGMLVLAWSNDAGETYPVAEMAAFYATEKHGATLLDVALGGLSGTLDLLQLANCSTSQSGRDPTGDAKRVSEHFLSALRFVAMRWICVLDEPVSWPYQEPALPGMRALQMSEAIRCLHRVAAASPLVHCGRWCVHAYHIAEHMERYTTASLGEPELFCTGAEGGMQWERPAWLRLHMRYQVERALHAARASGTLQMSRVISAWVLVKGEVCYFARSVGPQVTELHSADTAKSADDDGAESAESAHGKLCDMQAVAERRAEKAIAECALEFVGELHKRHASAICRLADSKLCNDVRPMYWNGASSTHHSTLQSAMETPHFTDDRCLDPGSAIAVAALQQQYPDGTTRVCGAEGPAHGSAIAVLGRDPPAPLQAKVAVPSRSHGARSGLAPRATGDELYERLRAYLACELCAPKAHGGRGGQPKKRV